MVDLGTPWAPQSCFQKKTWYVRITLHLDICVAIFSCVYLKALWPFPQIILMFTRRDRRKRLRKQDVCLATCCFKPVPSVLYVIEQGASLKVSKWRTCNLYRKNWAVSNRYLDQRIFIAVHRCFNRGSTLGLLHQSNLCHAQDQVPSTLFTASAGNNFFWLTNKIGHRLTVCALLT